MSNKTMVATVNLDEETYETLTRIAKYEGQPPNLVAARLLTSAVHDQEEELWGDW